MLAGLLFATRFAEDRPDRLVATLPFVGTTLIEHQARQLVAAGASQLIVIAGRLPPDLLGALARTGRGVTVDTVRSAAEAAEKLHPLSRVLLLGEGLVAADEAIAALTREGGDALLVIPAEDAARDWERVGGRMAWAGVARLQPSRVREAAALPRDYDLQSALLRIADQAGAAHVRLPSDALRHGHGLALGASALADRSRRVLGSLLAGSRNWFDRWVAAPVAGLVLPSLVERGLSGRTTGVAAWLLGLFGAAALLRGYDAVGGGLAFLGALIATIGATLAELCGEPGAERAQRVAIIAVPLAAALLVGWNARAALSDYGGLVTAVGLVLLAVLGERAIRTRERWWGGPPAYLLLVVISALAGRTAWGLAAAALYAAATLAAAIERWREQA